MTHAQHLTPCTHCLRHVRASDANCPFCGASVAPSAAPPVPLGRLSRAGLVAFGLAVAASSQASCARNDGATVTQGNEQLSSGGEGASTGTGVSADGGAVVSTDTQTDASTDADADAAVTDPNSPPNVRPIYGAPVARYGAPSPQVWEG
jgi:hypothetical protein